MGRLLLLDSTLLATDGLLLVPNGQSRLTDTQLRLLRGLAAWRRVSIHMQEGRTVPLVYYDRSPHSLACLFLNGTGVALESSDLIKQFVGDVFGSGSGEEIREVVWPGIALVVFKECIIKKGLEADGEV